MTVLIDKDKLRKDIADKTGLMIGEAAQFCRVSYKWFYLEGNSRISTLEKVCRSFKLNMNKYIIKKYDDTQQQIHKEAITKKSASEQPKDEGLHIVSAADLIRDDVEDERRWEIVFRNNEALKKIAKSSINDEGYCALLKILQEFSLVNRAILRERASISGQITEIKVSSFNEHSVIINELTDIRNDINDLKKQAKALMDMWK